MKPAPMMPTFLICTCGTLAGRRAPLLRSCRETNSERIIAAASGERSTLVKWRDSTVSARSIGSSRPSYTTCMMARAAG